MSLEARIKHLESVKGIRGDNAKIKRLIAQGKYYDELTEEEKDLYTQYLGYTLEAVRDVQIAVHGFSEYPHILLAEKPKKPTSEELQRNIEYVTQSVEEARKKLGFSR